MDIIPTPKKNIIFDSQILTALQKCPRYADFTFNHNRRPLGGKSNALECGSLVHTILEFYYKALKDGSRRNDAIDIGYEAGKEYIAPYQETNKYVLDKDHKGLQATPEESTNTPKRRTGYKDVYRIMQEYFDHWRGDNWTPLYVEHVLGKPIYEDDEIRVLWKAKYDLIEDSPIGLVSTDHKTASQMRDTISLNNQFIGQCVILGTRQMQVNKIGFQKSLPPHEKFIRQMVSYSVDRMTEWMVEIVPYYARMFLAYAESEYYPPNFSQCENKYGYCEFKNVCERDRNMRLEVLAREYREEKPWDISNDT
jgi:hypothetical protein